MEWSVEGAGRGPVGGTGRVAVLVLGMHRSGTSAVSGVLNILGAETPGELIPAALDNERGFFENRRLVILNDEILTRLGSSWDDPLPLPHSWLASPLGSKVHRDLCQALAEEFGEAPFVTIKDPRICRMVPLWLGALSEVGLRPVAVIPVRHPLEVASSISKRNGTLRSQTLLSWLDHTLSAERSTRDLSRSFLRYNDILTDWRSEMDRVAVDLNLVWSRDPMRVVDEVARFLGNDLRHHSAEDDSFNHNDPLERICGEVWRAVSAFCGDTQSPNGQQTFDKASEEVLASLAFFAPLIRGLIQNERSAGVELERQNSILREALESLGVQHVAVAQLNSERDDLRRNVESQDIALMQLSNDKSHLADELVHLEGKLVHLEEAALLTTRALQDENDATLRRAHGLDFELHNASTRLASIEGSTSWRLTRPMRTVLNSFPVVRKAGRRILRGSWWIITGQFFRRMRARRQVALDTIRVVAGQPDSVSQPHGLASMEPPEKQGCIDQSSIVAAVVQVPFDIPLSRSSARVAVLCHIFHDELTVEIIQYIRNVGPADVFISTDSISKEDRIREQLRDWSAGAVDVRVVRNRGRDIAPKIVAFKDVYDNYEYVLHIHSKRSVHTSILSLWRPYLFETLLGSEAIVQSVICAFERNPKLGIIAAEHFEPISHHINWAGNGLIAQEMAARMGFGLNLDGKIDFPSGSMFWMRSAALRPLLSLKLTFDDFPNEMGQKDATRAHAIERLFYFICEAAGFDWLKIGRSEFFTQDVNFKNISTIEDVALLTSEPRDFLFSDQESPHSHGRAVLVGTDKISNALLQLVQKRHLGSDIIPKNIKVFVGVVTYNNADDELYKFFKSVKTASREVLSFASVRTLVLDNGETSIDLKLADEYAVRVQSIGNVGFGKGHNRLMTVAFAEGADVYIAANPDGAFHPDAIGNLVRMSSANEHCALVEATQFPVEHPKPYDPATFSTPWASGACLLIPRRIFDLTGGFDDSFFMYAEDVDISWRTRAFGYEVKICPTALYHHAVTNRTVDLSTLKMIYESGQLLAMRWHSPPFHDWIEEQAKLQNIQLEKKAVEQLPHSWHHVADFDHHFSFAKARW